MKDREATRVIRELAELQHGVVAHWQLVDAGIGLGAIQRRTEGGFLICIYQGVYALGRRRLDQHGLWMAAVLASGPEAVLSHGSAMALWGMRGWRGPVEVLRRSGGAHAGRPEIRVHQTRALPGHHVTVERGIPVTTVERALLDMAGRLDVRQLERSLVAADRSGHVRWPDLQRLVARGRGKKGIARLRRVAMEVDPRAVDARSPLEVDFLALCREAEIPLPQVNVFVGPYLVDFFWPAQRLVVETDGYTYHRDRLAFESDHERTVELTAAGYEVHRATRRMLTWNPDPFLNLVRRSLQMRTASNSPTCQIENLMQFAQRCAWSGEGGLVGLIGGVGRGP
ncbi:MAG TPA: DUF559 domain-containing protein [Solirubrobacterales bacterium]|nr:DUF559 domain-containing protein [Solirubrobacterales bacterium]